MTMPNRAGPTRVTLVALIVVSLVLGAVTRQFAKSARQRGLGSLGSTDNSSLSSMNSYALALLLGGLRGPLVMILWPSAETQKSERRLEDFDTKIEWIRLLQAEFDTVHIFQIWNKAYNISVQMANVGNKYTTILDALDYANKVDSERPNNINILAAIGQIYFDKFGNSQEKQFYKRQVRTQTRQHDSGQRTNRQDVGWRRVEHDILLDDKGFLKPELLAPTNVLLKDPETGETYDGSKLQYLAPYQPQPYGLSPFAIAYSYYKRTQMLQTVGKQRHAQLSDLVIDSRPALSLRNWAEDEWRNGRRLEIEAYGLKVPVISDDFELESPTRKLPPTAPASPEARAKFVEALFSYDLCLRLVVDTRREYERHTNRYTTNLLLYRSHLALVEAMNLLVKADADYVRLILATDPAEKEKLRKSSMEAYLAAREAYDLITLRNYTSAELIDRVFPPGYKKETIENATPAERREAVERLFKLLGTGVQPMEFGPDLSEFQAYLLRCRDRIQSLTPAG